MCGPVLGLIGGIVSGIGAFMGAQAQAQSYRAEAAYQQRQAQMEREAGSYEAAQKQDQLRRLIGAQIAGYAANGLAITGSPLGAIQSSAKEGAKDIAAIRYGSRVRENNSLDQASISRMNATNASRAAPIAFLSPVIQSATRLGGSFG